MENKQLTNFVESHLRVRYAETDCMGIVYHANYLIWMEVGRTDYFRSLGLSYRDLEKKYQLFTPLIDINCRYLSSAVYDDEILIRTYLTQLNRRLIKFGYEIYRVNPNVKLATGESTHLVVDAQRKRATFPEEVLNAFQNRIYAGKDEPVNIDSQIS